MFSVISSMLKDIRMCGCIMLYRCFVIGMLIIIVNVCGVSV